MVFSQTPIPVRMIVVKSAAGADFAALAVEKFIDPTSADGGLLGRIDPNGLLPELRDALKGVALVRLEEVLELNRLAGREALLTSFNDFRTELAHVGMPVGRSANAVKQHIRNVILIVG